MLNVWTKMNFFKNFQAQNIEILWLNLLIIIDNLYSIIGWKYTSSKDRKLSRVCHEKNN